MKIHVYGYTKLEICHVIMDNLMKKRSKVPGVYTWGCRIKGGSVLSTSTYGPNTDKCFAEQQSCGIMKF